MTAPDDGVPVVDIHDEVLLVDFIARMYQVVLNFQRYWIAKHDEDPTNWPMRMPLVDWKDQFDGIFEVEDLEAIAGTVHVQFRADEDQPDLPNLGITKENT